MYDASYAATPSPADGESVKPDEAIAELETDKANVDVPSPGGGVLRHLKEEGDTVAVGEPIARIDFAGEDDSGNGGIAFLHHLELDA